MNIIQANMEHAVLTQAHRWYQLYERAEVYIENQLDILTDQIFLSSLRGEAHGKAAYQKRVEALPVWKNSHHIQNVALKRLDQQTIALEMDILYQNIGLLADGSLVNNHLHYSAKLMDNKYSLPKFSEIIISQNSSAPAKNYATFQDQYPENRARSLAHYWLFLIESPFKSAECFKEILAPEFYLSFPSMKIQDIETLNAWIKEADRKVLRSGHKIERFDLALISSDEYEIEMELSWRGFIATQPNVEFKARTLHQWILINKPSERFARIKLMNVHQLQDFQPCLKNVLCERF